MPSCQPWCFFGPLPRKARGSCYTPACWCLPEKHAGLACWLELVSKFISYLIISTCCVPPGPYPAVRSGRWVAVALGSCRLVHPGGLCASQVHRTSGTGGDGAGRCRPKPRRGHLAPLQGEGLVQPRK